MTHRAFARLWPYRGDRSSALPSITLLVGTAVLFSGLTAAVMTVASNGDNTTPPPTRASTTDAHKTTRMTKTGDGITAPTTSHAALALPPIGVAIPAIKVLAEVDPMGLSPNGQLEVPINFARVGWWSGGHKPGEQGPAVLEGHVDSTKGPAVFYALRRLHPGDEIHVLRSDRSIANFVVDRLASYPKNSFPSLDVYGPTDKPTLRLITCTGSFDRSRRSYRDNLVVYANLKS